MNSNTDNTLTERWGHLWGIPNDHISEGGVWSSPKYDHEMLEQALTYIEHIISYQLKKKKIDTIFSILYFIC